KSILSAMGSRKLPITVRDFKDRARYPSTTSEKPANKKNQKAAFIWEERIRLTIKGTLKSRAREIKLGRFIRDIYFLNKTGLHRLPHLESNPLARLEKFRRLSTLRVVDIFKKIRKTT